MSAADVASGELHATSTPPVSAAPAAFGPLAYTVAPLSAPSRSSAISSASAASSQPRTPMPVVKQGEVRRVGDEVSRGAFEILSRTERDGS